MYWCFGSQKHTKRINHAALVPESAVTGSDASAPENPNHPPALTLPFAAPPSSPASFLQSEPPSATQSPAGFLSFSLSANSYSSAGPSSIFAIGPYANETQLVSPPVFSTFTTEPSTAPFTPPPESIQLTNPSSPEVPFARLLTSSFDPNCKKSEPYEFQSYQLYPGSPIGHLISPNSGCSGTSSPFPDLEFHSSGGGSILPFPMGEPPKILSAEGIAERKLKPRHASRDNGSLLDGQITAATPQNNGSVTVHRVSFELTAEEVAQYMEKKPVVLMGATSEYPVNATQVPHKGDRLRNEEEGSSGSRVDETYHELPEKVQHSGELVGLKEFKFSNSDRADADPGVGSEWWVKEKVVGTETVPHKNWAFFPMIEPGVS